ncbi:MAG: phosphotransferase [Clostridia bacterium]|jgi:Ser/Thr protein kinase RdoA (MazF antagonist)
MTEQDSEKVGILLARLHKHSSSWQLPDGFERPQFGSDCIMEILSALENTTLAFTNDCMEAINSEAEKAMYLLDTYERTNATWGIIHADIIPPNLLYYKDEIRPIDFSACGFGYFLWDIATTLPFVPIQFRKSLLDAYNKHFPLPENHIELIEGFFVACSLQVPGFFLNLPDATEWMPDEYEKFSQRELRRYIEGRSFLFEGKPSYE